MLILKTNRIATAARMAKAATAMDLPRLPPLLPSRRALRGPWAHRRRKEGSAACLDESHPDIAEPGGDSRDHRHNPSAQRGRAAWTRTHTHAHGFPPAASNAAAAPAAASPVALRPRRRARSEQLQVCLALEQLLAAANEAPKQKGEESLSRASSRRVGTPHT